MYLQSFTSNPLLVYVRVCISVIKHSCLSVITTPNSIHNLLKLVVFVVLSQAQYKNVTGTLGLKTF